MVRRNIEGGGSVEVRVVDAIVSTCPTTLESLRFEENAFVPMLMVDQKEWEFEHVSYLYYYGFL